MLKYIKPAFWASPQISGVGRLPVNAIGVAGFLILGFGHPGFWLLGAAVETVYLYSLSMNERFRRIIDAEERQVEHLDAAAERKALIDKLDAGSQQELLKLEAKCRRVLELGEDAHAEDFALEGNRAALDRLVWLHLKLLVARKNLRSLDQEAGEREVRDKLARIESDLSGAKLTPSLRESKEATRRILQQRLANLERREQSLAEIDSDLTRIEAQIDLAVENAGMRGKPELISSNIDLVSQQLDDSVYGESSASIAALEQQYSAQI